MLLFPTGLQLENRYNFKMFAVDTIVSCILTLLLGFLGSYLCLSLNVTLIERRDKHEKRRAAEIEQMRRLMHQVMQEGTYFLAFSIHEFLKKVNGTPMCCSK
jgi:hypothetical protein